MDLQTFDELYVVSDLHMGGPAGHQIFSQGKTLAAFIRKLSGKTGKKTGLVLNGDIVDFLAEPDPSYLDPRNAVAKLKRIVFDDAAFKEVWSALMDFAAADDHHLVLVLGNHDVELALPEVKNWLLNTLSKGAPAARGRITICFDGAGFACNVGSRRVFCTHGNEVDTWNLIDYRQLRNVAMALNCGKTPEAWTPNAGTKLVIDVMNKIKQQHAVVDLLKPEIEAAVPIVIALKPEYLKNIGQVLKVAARLGMDSVWHRAGFLSAEEQQAEERKTEEKELSRVLNKYFDYGTSPQLTAEALMKTAYKSLDDADSAFCSSGVDDEFLGVFDYIAAICSSREKRSEKLRNALRKKLENDKSFDMEHKDATFKELDKQVGADVHFIVAGHTHLQRAFARDSADSYYFNSGTWARIIALTDKVLDNPEQFDRVYAAFDRPLSDLEKVMVPGRSGDQPLVMLRPAVVALVVENGETFGELRLAQPDGSLEPVENTKFPRR
ncbi:MAG: metallophosphoesterase [Nitrospirota bacterium]